METEQEISLLLILKKKRKRRYSNSLLNNNVDTDLCFKVISHSKPLSLGDPVMDGL